MMADFEITAQARATATAYVMRATCNPAVWVRTRLSRRTPASSRIPLTLSHPEEATNAIGHLALPQK